MELGTLFVGLLLVLLLVNQAVTRTRFIADDRVFWPLQAGNVLFATAVLLSPLPGLERVPAVKLVIGLLFVMRVVHNWRMRLLWRQHSENAAIEAEEAERAALKERERVAEREPPPGA